MNPIQELMKGELSEEVINNLKQADPKAMRESLQRFLRDDEVERIMRRVEELRSGTYKTKTTPS